MTRKRKAKRPGSGKRPPIGDYVVIIHDDHDKAVAVVLQSTATHAPMVGEEVTIRPQQVSDAPQLAGSHTVYHVSHGPPPGAPVTIRAYQIPYCHVRLGEHQTRRGPVGALEDAARVDAASDTLDRTSAAEVARTNREIATDLDDLADEVALAINTGKAGALGRSVVDRLNRASRRAKQISLSALVNSKFPRNDE